MCIYVFIFLFLLLFFFCFIGYSFLVCLKLFCCFFLDEIVVFLMFIYLLILYDRLSLCFVVCFSSWLIGFYVFIYLIKYVYAFLFGFIVFRLLAFFFYRLQMLLFFLQMQFSDPICLFSFTLTFFFCLVFYLLVLLFKCLNR